MKKKMLIVIILFFGMSIVPWAEGHELETQFLSVESSVLIITNGDTYYVGGDGANNYSKIQDAIDNASDDDTVFVYNGTYVENLVIGTLVVSKKIDLIGEDREITIIEGRSGGDPVIEINSIEVEVNGFTIRGNISGQDGIFIDELRSDVIITNNKIIGCAYGIWLKITSERNTITDNIISDNEFAGIRLQESDRNIIADNTIEDNGDWGISLEALSKQNNVSSNDVTNNNGGIKITGGSTQNDVIGNNVRDNVLEGILMEQLSNSITLMGNNITNNFGGIKCTSSNQNIITSNNIQDNSMEGLLLVTSKDSIITNNNFIGNRRQAAFRLSTRNDLDENYWDNWIGFKLEMPIFQKFPKFIGGFPPTFDWHPALEPYEI